MLSDLEYKLLIVFFAFALVICSVRTSQWIIEAYNRSVEAVEYEKKRAALQEEKISFSLCNPCTRDSYESIIPGQIIFLLFAAGLSLFRTIGTYGLSSLTLMIILFGYFDWLRATYYLVIGSEYYSYRNTSLSSYLLYNSTPLDFVLLFSVSVLLIAQAGFVVRFAAERIRARLEPNDQTPRP